MLFAEKIFKTNDSRNEYRYIHHETLKLNLQQHILYGLLFSVSGAVSGALSKSTGGSHVQDFVSGILFIVKYMAKR